jgi:hypothetical protein
VLGSPGPKHAYLGRYFDKAFKTDGNGNTTTNQTGVLSPEGIFTSTEPGQVVLTTRADAVSTNAVTATVNVLKLQLDANHDGVMDLTWHGPDNTSSYQPFVFWVNNDRDEAASGSNLERDLEVPPSKPELADYNMVASAARGIWKTLPGFG